MMQWKYTSLDAPAPEHSATAVGQKNHHQNNFCDCKEMDSQTNRLRNPPKWMQKHGQEPKSHWKTSILLKDISPKS